MTRALLLCLALALGCARPTPPSVLPPIPASVPSLVGPVPVVLVDSLTDEAGTPMMGGYSPLRRTIYLNRAVTDPTMRAVVLEHERCHADMIAVGLHNVLDSKVAQAVCDWIALREVRRLLAPR